MNVNPDIQQIMLQKQSTWLITGVAGFIGSNLLETLLHLNQKVIGLDNFYSGKPSNLEDVCRKIPDKFKANFRFIEGDIRSIEDCSAVTVDADYILHHAGVANVPMSIELPEYTNEVNVTGFINILNAARKSRVKRLVYASSSAVYGNSPIAMKDETVEVRPLSPYAVSKYANELYAKSFNTCFGLESVGLRYFNIFGPRQDPNGAYVAVIPLWINALLNEKTVYINGDGTSVRDFCYVNDVIQANLLAALTTNPNALNKVYNIGSGKCITLNQLLNYLKSIIQPEHVKLKYQEFKKGDIKISSADISNVRYNLGFSPMTETYQGLISAVDYYKINSKLFDVMKIDDLELA